MKIEIPWACDQCRVHKKESNHWYLGFILRNHTSIVGIQIVEWGITGVEMGEQVRLSMEVLPVDAADAHLCGANCVTEWLSKNLL